MTSETAPFISTPLSEIPHGGYVHEDQSYGCAYTLHDFSPQVRTIHRNLFCNRTLFARVGMQLSLSKESRMKLDPEVCTVGSERAHSKRRVATTRWKLYGTGSLWGLSSPFRIAWIIGATRRNVVRRDVGEAALSVPSTNFGNKTRTCAGLRWSLCFLLAKDDSKHSKP